MKTDDQVLAEATEIVRHQWCQGQYWNGEFGHEARYCAMGAVQKAAGLDYVSTEQQVDRIATRLKAAIQEQYPKIRYVASTSSPNWVEEFNDTHDRDEMLAIFEKAMTQENVEHA